MSLSPGALQGALLIPDLLRAVPSAAGAHGSCACGHHGKRKGPE